jgi:hypothetical protein
MTIPTHSVSPPGPPQLGLLWRGAVAALDSVVLLYGCVLLGVLLFGGFSLGPITASSLGKPFLVFCLALSVRVAIGGMSWLPRGLATVRAGVRPWVPAAVLRAAGSPALRDVLFVLLATRLAMLGIAFVANILIEPDRSRPFTLPFKWQRFLETFAVWDSGWYFQIASAGYAYTPDTQSTVAFFPLYPMLMRAAAWPFGGTGEAVWAAGIGVSVTAFAAALFALHRLAEHLTGSRIVAQRAILYLAVFPFSFYFTRVYTEAVFLLVTVLAVSAACHARWGYAGLFGALSTLTRPNGILIAIPLIILACADGSPLRVQVRRLAALLPVPFALLGFSWYVARLSGDPLAWLRAQAHWAYSLGHPPSNHLVRIAEGVETFGLYEFLLLSDTAPIELAYAVLAIGILMFVPSIVRAFGPRIGWALGAYVAVSVLIPLSGNSLVGMGRYISVLFPVFIVAAIGRSARVHEALLIISAMFLTLFLVLFVGWHPLH